MSTFIETLYRDLTCAAAAAVIAVIASLSFVQATSTAPGPSAAATTAAVVHYQGSERA